MAPQPAKRAETHWKMERTQAQAKFAQWYINLFTEAGKYLSASQGRDIAPQEVIEFLASDSNGLLDSDRVRAFCGLRIVSGDGNKGVQWGVQLG